jgi:DNA polymerase
MQEIRLHLDYETASEVDLVQRGLDAYASDPSTRILMAAWRIVVDGETSERGSWDLSMGSRMPIELREALADRGILKVAFNAEFERRITRDVAKIPTRYEEWRCTMAKAAMHSFTGSLAEVASQMCLPLDKIKDPAGGRLIKLFCQPQRITKNQQLRWRDWTTDPEEWERFCGYNVQDEVSEFEVWSRLERFPIWDTAWAEYALDQKINDRGIPVDVTMAENATALAAMRKAEIIKMMKAETGLANPNSRNQLLPWLKDRGYRFADLEKASVMKVIDEHEAYCKEHGLAPEKDDSLVVEDDIVFDTPVSYKTPGITASCYRMLKARRQASRTSVSKYSAFTKKLGPGYMFRHSIKFGGAARTLRYSGRGVQMQNLHSTPKFLEAHDKSDIWLVAATDAIRENDYGMIQLLAKEPMDLIAGCVRGVVRAPEGKIIRSCDLASIESVVIGWLSGCERLLNVFREGRDAYKDFATRLFNVPYDEVTSHQRKMSKPATLGAGYRLGGGTERAGKKTGLWGYAENMGVKMTQKESARSVEIFRETYPEIPQLWYDLESAIAATIRTGNEHSVGPVTFELRKPFLCAILPSGRRLYYYKPKLEKKTFISLDKETGKPVIDQKTGEPKTYTRINLTYMGMDQDTRKWVRIDSHGGKMTENLVQAIARDILQLGLFAADEEGFDIRFHVHDEINCIEDEDDEYHSVAKLRECMIRLPWWGQDIPLNAAGAEWIFYRKD